MIVKRSVLAVAVMGAALMFSGCDWSSGGGATSFNTSQGAGVSINLSGVYRGEFPGGRAVQTTTAGNITALTIRQTGNRVEVTDNQGSTYVGTVGSPGLVSQPSADGTYPAGAELAQGQINFSGKDGVSAKDIEFVGIIHVVAVTDIQGNTRVSSQTSANASRDETTRTIQNGDGTSTTETVLTIGTPDDPFYQVTTTTVVTEDSTGRVISNTSTTEGGTTTTQSTEFSITEATSQYRLEGTWVELGGKTSGVQARSAGTSGLITTTTEVASDSPTPTAQVTFF